MFNNVEVDVMSIWADDYMSTKDDVWADMDDVGVLYDLDGDNLEGDKADESRSDKNKADEDGAESHGIGIKDSFILSMRNKGYVDLDYMKVLTGATELEITEDLKGTVIWLDPDKYEESRDISVSWVSRQQLLRGNLYKKLKSAVRLRMETEYMYDTVTLLRSELPDMVEGSDIHVNLGSSWVPTHYIEQFVEELLDMIIGPKITYDEFRGVWTVDTSASVAYMNNNYVYGTMRMSAIAIIKKMLNARPVVVYDTIPNPDRDGEIRVINRDETLAAQEKQKLIMDAWQDFVHGDPKREAELQELYMEKYGYKCSSYDGSFLELADMALVVTPYPHQKDAIAHILLGKNTLLAHEVGSGKTLEICAGVHELIRIGLGHKALIVVPNTTFSSMCDSYRQMYPSDRVLMVSPKKDFIPAKRSETISKIQSSDHEVIIMAYSSFDMLTLSREYMFAKKEEVLREFRAYISRCSRYGERMRAEAELRRMNTAYEKYRESFKDSDTACFDELGIDILAVDEAHNYKNITIEGRVSNIVGMHSSGSTKANRMLEKVQYIQSLDSGHVIFATGTPITNSLADLYVLQRYLQPVELKLCHIDHFNDWINTFCEQVHSFEVDVDSKNFRFTTRFSKFHNIPELMAMFSDVCDFYQIADGDMKLPEFNGYKDVLVRKSDVQKKYIDDLAERTEAIRSRRVNRKEDNLLKITVDGRKCALDIRLVQPDSAGENADNKCRSCADKLTELYYAYPGTTQIVFCDFSTPKNGFNIYDEIKGKLVKRGVPENDIAYIHEAATEAQRTKIEKRFNAGDVRILIGSTMKLGIGTNVQERLIAVHHIDVPWRPADVGRILRTFKIKKNVEVTDNGKIII